MSEQLRYRARVALGLVSAYNRVRGWFASRAEASRMYEAGARAVAEAARALANAAEAERESDARIAELAREVRQLVAEKQALDAELTVRKHEVNELALCIERNRKRVEAEIALEIMRGKGMPARG